MRPLHAFSLLMLQLAPTVTGAQDAVAYRWVRQVELPEIAATTAVAVPLDSHFYQQTRPSWPDVRLSDERGEAIPFLIRTANRIKPRVDRRFWSAEQRSAKVDPIAGLQIELVLRDKESIPTGIRIITPLKDFDHQVQVEFSDDGEAWNLAGTSTLIFDYSRYVDARNDLVPFDAGKHRRFRITITDPTAEQDSQLLELRRHLRDGQETNRTEQTTISRRPFRIDRIEFFREDSHPESSELRTMSYPATDFLAVEDKKDHQTILTFSTLREPITEITIITSAENFSRKAIVQAEHEDSSSNVAWRQFAVGTLTRFAVGLIQREELSLTFPEHQLPSYRIAIENRDSPPLPITGVELSGPIYELIFLASPGQVARLEYDSADAPAGRYDTAALLAVLAQGGSRTPATLQTPRENLNALTKRGRAWTPWNDSRILVSGIVALTLMLGWGLFLAGKRIEVSPPSDR